MVDNSDFNLLFYYIDFINDIYIERNILSICSSVFFDDNNIYLDIINEIIF